MKVWKRATEDSQSRGRGAGFQRSAERLRKRGALSTDAGQSERARATRRNAPRCGQALRDCCAFFRDARSRDAASARAAGFAASTRPTAWRSATCAKDKAMFGPSAAAICRRHGLFLRMTQSTGYIGISDRDRASGTPAFRARLLERSPRSNRNSPKRSSRWRGNTFLPFTRTEQIRIGAPSRCRRRRHLSCDSLHRHLLPWPSCRHRRQPTLLSTPTSRNGSPLLPRIRASASMSTPRTSTLRRSTPTLE